MKKIAKILKKNGIIPLYLLKQQEKEKIAKFIVDRVNKFIPELANYNEEIYNKIVNTKMYYAHVNPKFKGIFYLYDNNALYIDLSKDTNQIDEFFLHECIHCIQNFSNITKKTNRVGLCKFDEFKLIGLGLNEAVTQYIVSKLLGNGIISIKKDNIWLYTNSEKTYQFITSLAIQILYLIGQKDAIVSAITSSDEFETLLYNSFEENTDKILKNFDILLKENNKLSNKKVIQIYFQTQELIYSTYFKKIYKYVNTIEEIDKELEKLDGYGKILGRLVENDIYYENFKTFKETAYKKLIYKYIIVNRQKTKNALVLVENNPFFKIRQVIINFINGVKEN